MIISFIILQQAFSIAIVPYIGAIAVFFSLIVNNFVSSIFRKRDVQRNWYLKVLIEPNIKLINEFYEKVGIEYRKSIDVLSKSKNIESTQLTRIKSTQIGKFQKVKRAFENNFIRLITLSYGNTQLSFGDELKKVILDLEEEKNLSEELTNIILDLEDFYTELLDYSSDDDTIERFENKLTVNKANLIKVLFRPLR